jgi:DNA-binding CsgD family transcriptional regulator
MTPEESSIFFSLLSGHADYLADDLQEHARGCNLPSAECRLCRLCELEIKSIWPDLWLSKWPGATPDETDEFTALEFEVIFGVCRGLPNKDIVEQCGLTEQIVHTTMSSAYDKAAVSNRMALLVFVMDTLNAELRRRSGRGESAS